MDGGAYKPDGLTLCIEEIQQFWREEKQYKTDRNRPTKYFLKTVKSVMVCLTIHENCQQEDELMSCSYLCRKLYTISVQQIGKSRLYILAKVYDVC